MYHAPHPHFTTPFGPKPSGVERYIMVGGIFREGRVHYKGGYNMKKIGSHSCLQAEFRMVTIQEGTPLAPLFALTVRPHMGPVHRLCGGNLQQKK